MRQLFKIIIWALMFYMVRRWWLLFDERQTEEQHEREDFIDITMGAFAKFAKADGRISEQEIAAVEEIINSWNLGPETAQRARDSFRAAKDNPRSFEDYINLATGFATGVRYTFLDCLVALACAEISGLQAKAGMLAHTARTLGFPYDLLRAMIVKHSQTNYYGGTEGYGDWRKERGQKQYGGGNAFTAQMEAEALTADYTLIGASPAATDNELKKAYYKKVKELHPDRLQSQGLPPQMLKVAADNLARVNTAYERIRESRTR